MTLLHTSDNQVGVYVKQLLEQAVEAKVTDIHIETYVSECLIRFKKAGVFETVTLLSKHLAPLVLTRIKILANMDINERRAPQDGQFETHYKCSHNILMRVSSIPTYRGESLAIRILDPRLLNRSLKALGMPTAIYEAIKPILKYPNGLIVIGGATGSGKTTTLYALLKELNASTHKILTVEDPVEYTLDNILQVSVCPQIGLTFAHCLRSFLRQDPDVIAVGEIRDMETAKTAVQAALTGHLVITTVHTGNFSETIARFRQFGLESYLLRACVRAIIQQKLSYTAEPKGEASVAFELLQGSALVELIQHWDQRI